MNPIISLLNSAINGYVLSLKYLSILDNDYLSSGDMNQDGQLDILDIVSLVNVIIDQ